MRIFILDDDEFRVSLVRRDFGRENVVWATTVREALTQLRNPIEKFDYIMLDHDLGGPFTEGPGGDGIKVAKIMAQEYLHRDTIVICHSFNPVGRKNMIETLKHTHFVLEYPFGEHLRQWLKEYGPKVPGIKEK